MKPRRPSEPSNQSLDEVALAICEMARTKDWGGLKKYLLACNALPAEHPAVQEAFMRSLPKDIAIFDRFLILGVDVDVVFQEGSALSRASRLGDAPRVSHILNRGAAVDLPADFGRAALYVACGEGGSSLYADAPEVRQRFLETIRTLLEAGANPNTADPDGYTALDLVASERWPEAVKLLFRFGARLEDCYDGGRFAVARTIRRGDTISMQMLLQHGADVTMVLEKRKNALALAKFYGRQDMLETLASAEGKRETAWKRGELTGQKGSGSKKRTSSRQKPESQPGDKKALAALKRLLGRYQVDLEATVDLVADPYDAEGGMAAVNRKGLRKRFQKTPEEEREIYLTVSPEAITLSSHGDQEEYPVQRAELSDEGLVLHIRLGGRAAVPVGLDEIKEGTIHLAAKGHDLGHYAWTRCKAKPKRQK